MKIQILARKIAVVTIILLIVACNGNRTIAAEDEYLGLEISKGTFSISEKIEIEITVIGYGIYFHGPCDWWFEKETDIGWEYVGECPDTNFTVEPFPQQPGDKLLMSLPVSETKNDYTYNYVLTTGVYRYGISYRTEAGASTSYSPQFELIDD